LYKKVLGGRVVKVIDFIRQIPWI